MRWEWYVGCCESREVGCVEDDESMEDWKVENVGRV